MDNVVPFAPRPNAGGGWTAAERERLSELADRLSAGGAKVEIVYGMTDEGDPWCVIKDDQEEVLIHVARINGGFVVHDASVDTIQQGETLWSACDRLLGGDWRQNREDVVVSLSGRQAQTLIALVVAATFIEQAHDAEAATIVQATDHQPALPAAIAVATAAQPAEDDLQRQDLLAPQHDGSSEPPAMTSGASAPVEDHAAETAAAPAAPEGEDVAASTVEDDLSTPEPRMASAGPASQDLDLRGTDGDDSLVGGAGHDTVQGGAGDDTLHGLAGNDSLAGGSGADQLYGDEGNDTLDGGGAPEGRFDFLDGGAGDDHLHVSSRTIARGGEGADTFIFAPRPAPDGLVGVALDYSGRQGDRLVVEGQDARVVSQQEQTNIFEGHPEFAAQFNVTKVQPGVRIGIDLNGDGAEDGYVLVGRPPADAQAPEGAHVILEVGRLPEQDAQPLELPLNRLLDQGDFLA
ncbi:MAG TPA: calcium-binding protein [Phenylobacterium sp.]|uniref:calcium-binding protein n=1 Tax=Phenylobacterium sp. TaxID=1871053 RepID=UPI002F936DE9